MELEKVAEKIKKLELKIENLECRLDSLEKIVGKDEIKVNVEVPRVILEKKPLDIRISEDELLGRIITLVKEGFFNEERTASDVANELMRRCWHPKDLQHVRPILEQLTALGVLERSKKKRKKGKGVKWVYVKGDVKILEKT
ncbi:MAG: hypothetical protein N3E48_04630 [Candidatus Bathyarchaeota archaeon]|nr:hypothetical protein [Candidatus Bathyarchaeota archaeon]